MNALWAKYGCTKCSEYPVLVLTVNFSDAKTSFQTNFITKYGVKTPCVPKEDGGATFNTALSNNNYGGPKYLICPDKSIIKNASEQTIINKGIKPHVCSGGVDTAAPKVIVTSPAASAILKVGAKHNILWAASDNIGIISIVIRFSSNSGATWTKVDSSAGNTGVYTWTVPNNVSKTCWVKVTAYDSVKNAGSDTSGVFEIQPVVGITNFDFPEGSIAFKKTPAAFMVFIPSGEYRVTVTDVSGKKLTEFRTFAGKQWYTIPGARTDGMQIVSLQSAQRTIVKKVWSVR